MSASTQIQTQSGTDSATNTRGPAVVKSTRTQGAQVSTQISEPSTQRTVQSGAESVSTTRRRPSVAISFTIKITNNLPPSKT